MNAKNYFKFAIIFVFIPLLFLTFGSLADATDQYAARTGKGCIFCHQESTGGQLKITGFAYIKNGYRYPIPDRILEKAQSLQSPFHRILRFIFGYLHLMAATVFFGTIFYIHLFVGPRKLKGGIPKAERLLGLSCMGVLTLTGIYLTWIRIDKLEQFFNNTFGLMLFIKICLFALMVCIGLIAVTVIHQKMKSEATSTKPASRSSDISRANLSNFDGLSGRPAYIVYQNKIYDVTKSLKWKDGRHFAKHSAGTDLTRALAGAPHDEEVLENIPQVGTLTDGSPPAAKMTGAIKVFVTMAYINLIIIFLILACISVWRWDFPFRLLPEKRAEVLAGQGCVECHREETPGIYHGWKESVHAKVDVGCYDCHKTDPVHPVFSENHLDYDETKVSLVVTPKTCGGCHPEEVKQYSRSKHANTLEIMWKVDKCLNEGLNNAVERTTGCYACHGTVVELVEGRPVPGTWPNVGVGRKNPDGTLGSCSSCHTRHKFSVVEARKPEACDQCHLGPDHPQMEIYNESKHGTIYHAEGDHWNWKPEDGEWKAGRDYRTPTCAGCHISKAGDAPKTHDQTERLSWETQAPLTVRPSQFEPFPAKSQWEKERRKMVSICLQCHSETWAEDHFSNLDEVVQNYNQEYYTPVKKRMDELYEKDILTKAHYFDEELEWQFYELWHHEGRRARMGAAMMAPDYAWWHGFYELKHRFLHIVEQCEKLEREGKGSIYKTIPGRLNE
jgi:predicted heme/steroid binding protein